MPDVPQKIHVMPLRSYDRWVGTLDAELARELHSAVTEWGTAFSEQRTEVPAPAVFVGGRWTRDESLPKSSGSAPTLFSGPLPLLSSMSAIWRLVSRLHSRTGNGNR